MTQATTTQKEWTKVTVGEIAEVIGGGTPSSKVDEYWGGSIPWLTPKDLSGYAFRRVKRGRRNITDSGLANSSARLLPKNTVLVTSRAPIGYVALADNEIATNQGFKSLILNDGYDPDFFYYLIKHNVPILEAVSSGTTFKEISGKAFKQIKFNVPPLPEQKAIAHILGSLDDKIELNRRMNETLEAMAQALFKSWFVDFDPVIDNALAAGNPIPDELKEKAAIRQGLGNERKSLPDDIRRLFPSEFAYTEEIGWIPKGWEMLSVGEVSSCFDNRRIPLSRKQRERKQPGTIPYYGATSIMDYINEYIFNDIFLLIGEDGSVVKEDGSPFTQYIWGQTWVNNHAHVLQGASGITTEHLMLFLQSQNIRSYTTGAVQLKINQKNMNSIPFLFAENKINEYFESLIDPLYERMRKLSDSSKKLYKIQDALLPRLLSGEILMQKADKPLEEVK